MKKYNVNIPNGIYKACQTNSELDIFTSENRYYYLNLEEESSCWFEPRTVKVENGILEIIE